MTPAPALPSGAGQYEAWGQLRFRPNCFAPRCTPSDVVTLQYRPPGSPVWTSVGATAVTNPLGYFDIYVGSQGPGSWRAVWTGGGATFTSREASVSY